MRSRETHFVPRRGRVVVVADPGVVLERTARDPRRCGDVVEREEGRSVVKGHPVRTDPRAPAVLGVLQDRAVEVADDASLDKGHPGLVEHAGEREGEDVVGEIRVDQRITGGVALQGRGDPLDH